MPKNKLLIGALVGVCSLGAVLNFNVYAKEDQEESSLVSESLENETEDIENIDEECHGESEGNEESESNVEEVKDNLVINMKNITKLGKSLQDVTINKDKNLPNDVGINAKKANSSSREFPLLPGFSDTNDGIIGKVPNAEGTTIEMYKTELTIDGKNGEYYVVMTSSNITSDKAVQSYIKQILSFYEGKEYSVDIGGINATIMIKK